MGRGHIISSSVPICNILSTEWYLNQKSISLQSNYSKSIWIPTQSGDIPINYLYSNIEETLTAFNFNINTSEKPNSLSSDINIICSHGTHNISETQVFYVENTVLGNLINIVGEGKILIFFVCYSGSMKDDFFRNRINSVVKTFISKGYEAIIAPFWALDVTIPKYWLPEFLKAIDAGSNLNNAVFLANKKVQERYPTPEAWACMHLYGNGMIAIHHQS